MPASSEKSDVFDIRTRILISAIVSTVAVFLKSASALAVLSLVTFAYLCETRRWKVMAVAYLAILAMSLLSVGVVYGLFAALGPFVEGTSAASGFQSMKASMTADFHTPFLRMIPSFNVILALTLNLSVQGFTGTMKSWHFPRAIYIPLMVFCRFVPEFIEVVAQLRDAVRMRGFSLSFGSGLIHPVRTLRLTFVPLAVKTLRMADNLAIAAEMKRVGCLPHPTALRPLCMRWWDGLALGFALALSCTLIALQRGGLL